MKGERVMRRKNEKRKSIRKSNLEKVTGGRKYKKVNGIKVFHETGRIIANPLIYKDYDYFNEQ